MRPGWCHSSFEMTAPRSPQDEDWQPREGQIL
jgi:hypothetical protein